MKNDDCGPMLSSDQTGQGFIQGLTFDMKPVTYSVVEEEDVDTGEKVKLAMFEGCIVLGTVDEMEQLATTIRDATDAAGEDDDVSAETAIAHGVGVTGHRFRWPGGIVPYEIHSGLPNKRRVTDAIAHWRANTRIRFVNRTSSNASRYPNYIRFRSATGCWSSVGMRGGRQDIGLARGCGTGSTIHEIGHAVGLWHEQSREDRNRFIRVRFENIQPGREHNFNQHITDGDDYGRYDYGSIMHYHRTAFSRNGQPTIVSRQPGVTFGQRSRLSTGDISAVRAMYSNLEPSRSWVGVQARGTVRAGRTQCWFTHSWPAFWNVNWNVAPTGPARDAGAQIEWTVRATQQSDTAPGHGALLKYFICVKNLVNYNVGIELRYQVSGFLR